MYSNILKNHTFVLFIICVIFSSTDKQIFQEESIEMLKTLGLISNKCSSNFMLFFPKDYEKKTIKIIYNYFKKDGWRKHGSII